MTEYGTVHENELTAGEIKSRQFRDADGALCHLSEDLGNGYWRYYLDEKETILDEEVRAARDRLP